MRSGSGTLFAVIALCFLSLAQDVRRDGRAIPTDEYEILGASIDFFQQSNTSSHPLVADHTSTFECGSSCNGMSMGGCNGLRSKSETPGERLKIVKRDLPELEETTLREFETKNQSCSEFADRIPTKLTYFAFSPSHGPQLPKGWEHPDFFYFSRIAFNPQHTQALVHISFMSGTDANYSGGKYFLFVKTKNHWKLRGTSAVWQLNP